LIVPIFTFAASEYHVLFYTQKMCSLEVPMVEYLVLTL
jgi:hypothetical protein